MSYRVSQKEEKQISYINAYIWNLKKWYDEPIYRTADRHAVRKRERGAGRPDVLQAMGSQRVRHD